MKAIVIPTSLNDKPYLIDLNELSRELDTYYKYIGCDCIDFVTIYSDYKRSVDVIVDDTGLLNGSPINEYWKRACEKGQANYPLAGKTVISMTNRRSGETCKLDLDFVKTVLVELYAFTEEDLQCIEK